MKKHYKLPAVAPSCGYRWARLFRNRCRQNLDLLQAWEIA